MAKKAVSNTSSNIVTIESKLNTEDVLAIITSRAETALNDELKESRKYKKKLTEDCEARRKDFKELYAVECKAAAQKFIEEIQPILSGVGYKAVHDFRGHTYDQITVMIGFTSEDENRSHSGGIIFNVDKSSKLADLMIEVSEIEKELKKIDDEIVGILMKIQNIPMLERRGRAKIAEQKLSESAEGRQLLESITFDLESELLALPSH